MHFLLLEVEWAAIDKLTNDSGPDLGKVYLCVGLDSKQEIDICFLLQGSCRSIHVVTQAVLDGARTKNETQSQCPKTSQSRGAEWIHTDSVMKKSFTEV